MIAVRVVYTNFWQLSEVEVLKRDLDTKFIENPSWKPYHDVVDVVCLSPLDEIAEHLLCFLHDKRSRS